MKKGCLTLLIGISLLIAGGYYYLPEDLTSSFLMSSDARNFHQNLKRKVDAGYETIYFHELNDKPWDMVCVLAPYSHQIERMKDMVKADISGLDIKAANISDDNTWVFVFVQDNKANALIKTQTTYTYALANDRKGPGQNCLDRNAAFFVSSSNTLTISQKERP